MDRFIGLAAHLSSCTLVVVGPSGKRLQTEVVATDAGALAGFVRSVRGIRLTASEIRPASRWRGEWLMLGLLTRRPSGHRKANPQR
jgi:hypothetical protein